MSPCMYNPLMPPYGMMMPQQPNNNNFEKAFEIFQKLERRQLKKELKKEEESKKNKQAPKKLRDFTFFETFAILTVASPWLGPLISNLQHDFIGIMLR